VNQAEFMKQLRQELARVGQTDIDDIVSDFTEHFANGIANGKQEADIARELGDPAEIAAQYASELPERMAAGTRYTYRRNDMPESAPGSAQQQGSQSGSAGQSWQHSRPGHGTAGQAAPGTVTVTRPDNRAWMIALLVLLNLFIVLPVVFSLIGILLSLWLGASGIGIAAGALFVAAVVKAGFVSIILIMFGLALTALTILAFIGVYYLTKLFVIGMKAYISWNRKLVAGGAAA